MFFLNISFIIFKLFYMVFRAPEASRKLPEARGFVFPKYEPVASHGDPIHVQNDLIFSNSYVPDHQYLETLSHFLIFWWVLRVG